MNRFINWVTAIMLMSIMFVMPGRAEAAGLQLVYDGASHNYTGSIYSLYVNGNAVHAALDPIIFNDHALVPVREVFEECGADVEYTGETRCVEIQYNKSYIRLYINDNCAYVNGKKTEIPDNVVPKLINKPGDVTKTMVPVRFISETVGMAVDFDGDNGSIYINADSDEAAVPVPTVKPTTVPTVKPTAAPTAKPTPVPVNIVDLQSKMLSDTSMQLTVICDGSVEGKYSYFDLKDPERVVIDFIGMGFAGGDENIKTNSNGIKAIRSGVTSERTRIVVDVEALENYTVSASGKNKVVLTVSVSGAGVEQPQKPTPTPTKKPAAPAATQTNSADSKKVVMIDAGHGGSDPGAIGTLDGKKINEKDLTLSISHKVKNILESKGYATSMTRTGDTLPSLAERPEQANEEGCALFVSIHINSAEAEEAHGTEVYWSQENQDKIQDKYKVTGTIFAKNILTGMLKYTSAADRGVKQANWAVTRRSDMPAILAEVGFISNEDELRKMCSDDYQNKVAQGIAEGIIKTLNAM